MLAAAVWPVAVFADQDAVSWGEATTHVYDNLHPYTLNWSGDPLDKGGLSLTDLKTASAGEADIVINQYGDMGAAGILKLSGEGLEDKTERGKSGVLSSVRLEEGAVYLVKRHDGKLAKIRIDAMTGGLMFNKVTFTFVLEDESAASQRPAPAQKGAPAPADAAGEPAANSSVPAVPAVPAVPSVPPSANTGQVSDAAPSAPGSFSIYLRLKSIVVTTEQHGSSTDHFLPVAPFLSEGRTMVPLRFIAEALGAEVKWGAEDQSIELIGNNTRIQLWVNRSQAVVNGQAYELDAPPALEKGTTVVPLRFVSEHMNMNVYYQSGQILITDGENPFFETIASAMEAPPWIEVPEYYYGKWNLWVPGGYARTGSQMNFDGSWDVQYTYTPGADADWLEIRSDGTYTWQYLGEATEGYWGIADLGNIKLYNPPVSLDGEAWTMRYENEEESTIYAWGMEYHATKAGK